MVVDASTWFTTANFTVSDSSFDKVLLWLEAVSIYIVGTSWSFVTKTSFDDISILFVAVTA